MARRVRVASDKEDFVRSIAGVGPENASDAAFESMADALAFAAFLGFKKRRRISLSDPSKKIDAIRPEYIPHDAINLIGLLSTKTIDSLHEQSEIDIVTVFEEYANGGLELLEDILKTKKLSSMRVNALIAELQTDEPTGFEGITGDDCEF